MLLTITTTHSPATDLGYLLHKNPARAQSFPLSFGQAHVFYPEAAPDRCTVALLLDVDTVALVRGPRGSEGRTLAQYVNDRPYVASSFLSVAIAQVFGSALGGRCADKPELVQTPLPLEACLQAVPSRSGEEFLRRLFEPLGYTVKATPHPLDATFPEWGDSPYFTVRLTHTLRLSELLSHLYVLIPTLDASKHYAIGDEEVDKLIRKGEGWLAAHPEKDAIVRRYLKHRRSLVRDALAQLTQEDEPEADESEARHDREEAAVERRLSLHDQRLGAVLAALKQSGARRVLDLGCGEGRLLELLLKEKQFTHILGMDVSYRSLENAQDNLHLDRLPPMQRERIQLIQGSLIYRDARLEGYEAAAVVEAIEHLDLPRLAAFERVLFEFARPQTVVVTTPNREYNPKFETLPAGQFRHKDHRFEWTRAEFQDWAQDIAARFGYAPRFLPLGPEDAEVGAPSQMAVFEQIA
ncbi:MAG: 3' terminal RNA ribose 2'-O-methyltransferase Hen1 [Armatimonadota bacterium]|nr:3' terminal RNA ribose 2'-O-methyltransferase Hen1 [Armatimonadota bacterium]